jgi:hypothetical protein
MELVRACACPMVSVIKRGASPRLTVGLQRGEQSHDSRSMPR